MNTDSEIGRRVGALMDARGITQTSMAARMGITQAAISRKLSGERPWFADELATVAGLLGVGVGELFGEHRKPRRLGGAAAMAQAPARRKAPAPVLVFSG
jgi:transcriptional regulator with XRE-family HTH domain